MNKNAHKPTYISWHNMKGRCLYKSMGNYERYGAKGAVWNRIKAGWTVEKAVTTGKVGTAY